MHPLPWRRLAALVCVGLIAPLAGAAPGPRAAQAARDLETRGSLVARVGGQPRVLLLAADEIALPVGGGRAYGTPAGVRVTATDAARQVVRLPAGMSGAGVLAVWRMEAAGGAAPAPAGAPAPVFYELGRRGEPGARHVGTELLLLPESSQASAEGFARETGASAVLPGPAADLWLLRYESAYEMLAAAAVLGAREVRVEPQFARRRYSRAAPNDPLYGQQFYFKNTGQGGGTAGVDLNVESLWPAANGAGVTVSVVDDGLELTHPDLAANVATDSSLHGNVLLGGNDPTPAADDSHGTICAGFIAARGNNGVGITGAAPQARLVGVRLLGGDVTDAQEAAAFGWRTDVVSISSNSWGPDDDGKTLSAPDTATLAALRAGVTTGRSGRGVIYVVATGNGRADGDHAGYDGYSGNRHVIAVGATDNKGKQATFSESGPQVLVVAIGQTSEGNPTQLLATDTVGTKGENKAPSPEGDYTTKPEGTSYAAPQVSGVAALMLQANPLLGWRDVKEILIRTARKTDASDADWITNGGGIPFNHRYGAGFVDATAALALARTWSNLAAETSLTQTTSAAVAIPDNAAAGATQALVFAAANLRVETVEVTVSVTHANRGQLQFEVTSPAGTRTVLGLPRAKDTGADLANWTFSTPRHWGEPAAGTWTVRVIDTVTGTSGTLTAATVKLYGAPAAAVAVPVIAAQPASVAVATGASASFTASASGGGLTYQWRKNGLAVPGATSATLSLTNVSAADAGSYDVVVRNSAGSVTSSAATLVVAAAGPTARLGNLSVRTSLAAGEALTVGFVVNGGAKPVLIRAIGPTLGAFGVEGVHPDPKIELYSGATKIDENDDWDSTLEGTFAAVGAFPLTARSLDAALRRTISDAHTARISGAGSGVILLEAYDAGTGNIPRFVNVSARNQVGTGGNIMIAGFVVQGEGTKRILIRAVGPTLAAFGVEGTLVDPKLELYGETSARVAQNDDWTPDLSAAFGVAGAFALTAGSKDAALVVSLAPGSYTVQVSGADGGTGEALVEVYDLEN